MARPYFTGNYGSALAKVDTRPIIEAGRAQGQMYANLGAQVGGMIKEYGLNKAKKEKATNEVEGILELYPEYATQLTSSGDETSDKKNQNTLDKLKKGELGLSGLEGLLGKFALMERKDAKELAEANAQRQIISDQLNQDLLKENLKGKKQGNIDAKALADIRTRDQGFLDAAYKRYDTRIHQLLAESTKPDFDIAKLLVEDQKILANYDLIQNRQVDLDKLFTMPGEKVDLAAARQGLKNAQQAYKKGEQDIKLTKGQIKDKKDARKPGPYADLDAVNTELKSQFDKGFIASAEVKPDGTWNITKIVPIAEAINDLIPIPGHPDVYRFQDSSELFLMPPGETPRKIGVGEGTEARLKQVYLSYFNDGTARFYAEAMRHGPLEDGEYTWDDEDGNEQIVPYDSGLETKVFRIRALEKELREQIFDIPPTPPPRAWYHPPAINP